MSFATAVRTPPHVISTERDDYFAMRMLALAVLLLAAPLAAGELPDFDALEFEGLIHTAIGVTPRDTVIHAFVSPEDIDYSTPKSRILLIGGLDGKRESVDAVLAVMKWFYGHADAAEYRKTMLLSAVPCANPDGVLRDEPFHPEIRREPARGYPPKGDNYSGVNGYLWQFISMHAPDIVIDMRDGKESRWLVPEQEALRDYRACEQLAPQEVILTVRDRTRLVVALASKVAVEAETPAGKAVELLQPLFGAQAKGLIPVPTLARKNIAAHLADFERVTFREIVKIYAEAKPRGVNYMDTLPHLAYSRMQAAKLLPGEPDAAKHLYLDDLEWPAANSGSALSGRLVCLQMARYRTSRRKYLKLAQDAADLAFGKDGAPLAEPPFHSQMSDAVFMNGPLLSGVGAHTGDKKYFDCCAQHQAFMRKLCKRDDGLYRHSPLNEAAWGRGNGFVALGLALMLEDWPEDHPERKVLLEEFQSHMAALQQHQDYTGLWHQVIDRPESYREFSCTAMIGFAMARGVRGGWLEREEYQPCLDRAWTAAKSRCHSGGVFVDVCTGTGKQESLRAYYDRKAITGKDDRGGSMMLLFASEMLRR